MSFGRWVLLIVAGYTVTFFGLGLIRGRFDDEITFTAAVQTVIIVAGIAIGQAVRGRERR